MKDLSNASKNAALFSVMTILMISIVPSAFAMSTPGASTTPDPIAPGGVTNISFEESDEAPHGSMEGIYVFDPDTLGNQVIGGLNCPMPVATVGDYWVLLTNGGTTLSDAINYYLPDNNPNSAKVSVPFGTGADVVITPTNGAKVGTGIPDSSGTFSGAFDQSTPLAGEWHRLTNVGTQNTETVVAASVNSDDTTLLGQYTAVSCGEEEDNFAGNYLAPVNFEVIEPVGGEIISLNTSALLLAGITSSGLWIIPTLGVAVGTGISLYKIRRHN